MPFSGGLVRDMEVTLNTCVMHMIDLFKIWFYLTRLIDVCLKLSDYVSFSNISLLRAKIWKKHCLLVFWQWTIDVWKTFNNWSTISFRFIFSPAMVTCGMDRCVLKTIKYPQMVVSCHLLLGACLMRITFECT